MKKNSRHPHRLLVEGRDTHAIIHLATAHGADFDAQDSFAPYVEEAGGFPRALEPFATALKAPGLQRVGLVLDADLSASDRWDSVRNRLASEGVVAPSRLPPEGWTGTSPHGARAGVWLMPDNRSPGRLEELMAALIPATDPCWSHARAAAAQARALGAPFREIDLLKAELHTWLAWRERPGTPFGTAIRSRYLLCDTPEALAFVGWFMRLFRDS